MGSLQVAKVHDLDCATIQTNHTKAMPSSCVGLRGYMASGAIIGCDMYVHHRPSILSMIRISLPLRPLRFLTDYFITCTNGVVHWVALLGFDSIILRVNSASLVSFEIKS